MFPRREKEFPSFPFALFRSERKVEQFHLVGSE